MTGAPWSPTTSRLKRRRPPGRHPREHGGRGPAAGCGEPDGGRRPRGDEHGSARYGEFQKPTRRATSRSRAPSPRPWATASRIRRRAWPAGIVEKFRTWSDCDGDVESRFSKDELLTNIMIYWVTGTINSSVRLYCESMRSGLFGLPPSRVEVPTAGAIFPKEIIQSAPRLGRGLVRPAPVDGVHEEGGHFAALEVPGAARGRRAALLPYRTLKGAGLLAASAAVFAVALGSCTVNSSEGEAKSLLEAKPSEAEAAPEWHALPREFPRADERDAMVRQQIVALGELRPAGELAALRAGSRATIACPRPRGEAAYEDRQLPIGRRQTISQPLHRGGHDRAAGSPARREGARGGHRIEAIRRRCWPSSAPRSTRSRSASALAVRAAEDLTRLGYRVNLRSRRRLPRQAYEDRAPRRHHRDRLARPSCPSR